ncbi:MULTISPECIES: RES family NAD+ phosphorylase [Paraburkholderia]|uniref:RES family NAD+ phosphorylase n=1 Tax=Paraburkholderia TaxID=1822464 RepID=UPI0032185C99
MASGLMPPPRKPVPLLPVAARGWYRVHDLDPRTGKFSAASFNDSGLGNARFSPLRRPDTGEVVPTIYAASTMRGAIMETVLHNVPVPASGYVHDIERDLASNLHMSTIAVREVQLVNLTSTGLRAAGLKRSDLFDGDAQDYPRTREWAAWLWAEYPDAQGLIWMSKQDDQSQAVMLFGDRMSEPMFLDKKSHIADHEDLIIELLAEMDAKVTPVA